MTEMINVPASVPPTLRPYVSAMLHGLWGWVTRPLQVIVKAGVPDALGEEPQSAAALAAVTGCDADALDRFLRMLAACDIFERRPDNTYAHTPISRCLRRDSPVAAAPSALLQGMPVYQAALANLEHTLRTGLPAIDSVAPNGFFGYLRAHPDEARIFDAAMTSLRATHNDRITTAYDFSASNVIADIGGGQGALLGSILERAPNVRAVLFDLPDVVAGTASTPRLRVQAGDFFRDPLPAADLYILKLILHDWPDAAALKILAAIRRSAQPGVKLLVIEAIMTDEPGFSPSHVMDLSMLALTGGRERNERQFGELFAATGFRLARTIPTESPVSTIVEAVAA